MGIRNSEGSQDSFRGFILFFPKINPISVNLHLTRKRLRIVLSQNCVYFRPPQTNEEDGIWIFAQLLHLKLRCKEVRYGSLYYEVGYPSG